MKAVVAAFNQEKALVGAFSVITNLRMQLFEALVASVIISYHWLHLIETNLSFLGNYIVREGTSGDTFYIISDGEVLVTVLYCTVLYPVL